MRSLIDTRIRVVLKEAREDSDVSQKALGRALNLTHSQIANLEGGQRTVRVADLVMIAIALGFEPEKILRHALHGAASSCPHCQERARRRGAPESDPVALLREEMRL
jgi:transcriptional regulator with XRE-family HTH domain